MKIGFFGINFGVCGDPVAMIQVAKAAEQAGLESVWTGEHVVLPDPRVAPSPSEPQTPFLDPVVALSHIAAHTVRLRLGTGVIILPQRNPVVLAKELATLDVVSGGRLLFGLGAGYLEAEFRALGAPLRATGRCNRRSDRSDQGPLDDGKTCLPVGDSSPSAALTRNRARSQKPHPPIHVGGMSRHGARRAARYGDGWYGFRTDPEATKRSVDWIRDYIETGPRPSELGDLEISVTPPIPISIEVIRQYEDIGVHRLIPWLNAPTLDDALRYVDELGALLSG